MKSKTQKKNNTKPPNKEYYINSNGYALEKNELIKIHEKAMKIRKGLMEEK